MRNFVQARSRWIRLPVPPSLSRTLLLCCFALWSVGAFAGHYTLPLLVWPDASGDPQGVLRILNGTDESGKVEIYAIDDSGTRTGPVTFTLNASAAVEFTTTGLQSGNASLGLTGGIGMNVTDAEAPGGGDADDCGRVCADADGSRTTRYQ